MTIAPISLAPPGGSPSAGIAPGRHHPRLALLPVLLLLMAGLFAASLSLGSVGIPPSQVVAALAGQAPDQAAWATIIRDFRLPKALTAALAGAGLAVSGLQLQTLFANPLADPFVLGISSGASVGVALVVLGGAVGFGGSVVADLGAWGSLGTAAAASLGSAAVLLCILVAARRAHSVVTLLIVGLMIGYASGAVVTLLLSFSAPQQIQGFLIWTFGTFDGVTWDRLEVFAPLVLLGLALAQLSAKPLNALLLGERYARSLGVDVRRARLLIVAGASLLAGAVTAFCGPIGFLGLAAPHVARRLARTADHRLLLPVVALLGSSLALACDLVTHLPANQTVLPLNAVTALCGAPLVIVIMLRRRHWREEA